MPVTVLVLAKLDRLDVAHLQFGVNSGWWVTWRYSGLAWDKR
jgi:hypothetical protein